MRFVLTRRLIEEAQRFELRMACRHCVFYLAGEQRCGNEWPDLGQSRWPLALAGDEPEELAVCKEFELA